MKRLVIMALAVLMAAVLAQTGSATGRSSQSDVGRLKAQVTSLQAQVKTLRAQVKTLQQGVKNLGYGIEANFVGDACLAALTADAFAGTWQLTDQLAQKTGNATLFGSQSRINDKGACAALRPDPVMRQDTANLPVFQALISWLLPSSIERFALSAFTAGSRRAR